MTAEFLEFLIWGQHDFRLTTAIDAWPWMHPSLTDFLTSFTFSWIDNGLYDTIFLQVRYTWVWFISLS